MKSRISVFDKVVSIVNACTHLLHAATSRGQFLQAITCNKVVSIINVCNCMRQGGEHNLRLRLHTAK